MTNRQLCVCDWLPVRLSHYKCALHVDRCRRACIGVIVRPLLHPALSTSRVFYFTFLLLCFYVMCYSWTLASLGTLGLFIVRTSCTSDASELSRPYISFRLITWTWNEVFRQHEDKCLRVVNMWSLILWNRLHMWSSPFLRPSRTQPELKFPPLYWLFRSLRRIWL